MAERNAVFHYYNAGIEESSSDTDITTADTSKQNDADPDEKPEIEYRRTEARSGSLISIIFVSILAAVLLGTVIYSLDRRNTMFNKVADKNQELSLVKSDNVRLQAELESRISAKNVEDYAENVLGMKRIDSKTQIKYIKIQTGDVVNIPEQEKGLGAKIKGFFEKCVEYFRG